MSKSYLAIGLILVLVTVLLLGSCTSPKPSTTSSTSTTSTISSGDTFLTFASDGQTVFVTNCVPCHGASGSGGPAPALWGTSAVLAKYNTAQGLLDFISTNMPKNAPGSLSHTEYLEVMALILVMNSEVTDTDPLVESQLSSIALK